MTQGITVNQVPIIWDDAGDRFSFFGVEGIILWKDPSLLSLLKPLRDELGEAFYALLVAFEVSKGTYEDYHNMVEHLGGSFAEGFTNWGQAVSAAGWGIFHLESLDWQASRARVRVDRPWELQLFTADEPRNAVPFLDGKLSGIFSWAFGSNCRAQVMDNGTECDPPYVRLDIAPSSTTLGHELEQLQQGELSAEAHLRAANRHLREHLERFFDVVEGVGEFVWEVDWTLNLTFATELMGRILGYRPEELVGHNLRDFLTPDSRVTLSRFISDRVHRERPGRQVECQLVTRTGEARWFSLSLRPTLDLHGEPTGYRGAGRDITDQRHARKELEGYRQDLERKVEERVNELRQAEQLLTVQAYYDHLLGLPNQRYLAEHLEEALRRAREQESRGALVLLGLDRFRNINDSLGHAIGDWLLQRAAGRFFDHLPGGAFLAHPGGDEFALVVEDLSGIADDAATLAANLLAALDEPVQMDERTFQLTASVGIAVLPDNGQDAPTLIRNAHTALHWAKQSGQYRYRFYTTELTEATRERHRMEERLRQALRAEDLLLHFQPLVDLRTGDFIGAEALARWQDPDRGWVSPGEFVPLAEATGLILPLGDWVLREAALWAREWRDRGLAPGRISVNLSPLQLEQPELPEKLAGILRDHGLPGEAIELEVTESAFLHDADHGLATLQEIRELGVSLAIDDFGTGYSSLAYLKRLPLDRLKMDRSFVDGLPHEANDTALARAITALGDSLDLTVLAEGIETREQAQFLVQNGLGEGQGFLYARPMPPQELGRLLATTRT